LAVSVFVIAAGDHPVWPGDVKAVQIDDGLITGLFTVRNPEKLSQVTRETAVSR